MENAINRVHEYIWGRLYDDRTGMFYNHLASLDDPHATKYLPEPEFVNMLIPNPGGYGTGMEDCMLNAGLMMDAVVAQYEVTKDEAMREYASKIFKGIYLGATVSHKRGFLPRGVHPADRKSHYIDTSIDQYTDWLYASYRFYFSSLSDDTQKEKIRQCLTAIAEKFEEEVIPENCWSMLREDGKVGVAGRLWGENIDAHAAFRMPMTYLYTYKTTGDEHWKELYLKHRPFAIERSRAFVPLTVPTYAALQMQYSLKVVYDLEDDEDVRKAILEMMTKNAAPYEEMSVREKKLLMTEERRSWLEIPYEKWRESKYRFAGIWGGMGYFVPEPTDFREYNVYYPLRAVGEGIIVASTCPNFRISDDSFECLCEMIDFVDYDKHRSAAPIALLEAYWLALKSRK